MKKDEQALIKTAVEELGIDKPIMRSRVVGGRVELYLYGGDVVLWPAVLDLNGMSTAELKRLATAREIRGRSKMNRDQLIKALGYKPSDQVQRS